MADSNLGRQKIECEGINIFADDRLVFSSGTLSSDMINPTYIDLDMSGVIKMRIEVRPWASFDTDVRRYSFGLLYISR